MWPECGLELGNLQVEQTHQLGSQQVLTISLIHVRWLLQISILHRFVKELFPPASEKGATLKDFDIHVAIGYNHQSGTLVGYH